MWYIFSIPETEMNNMLSKARTIVFKVGTSTLTHETGKTNLKGMEELEIGRASCRERV